MSFLRDSNTVAESAIGMTNKPEAIGNAATQNGPLRPAIAVSNANPMNRAAPGPIAPLPPMRVHQMRASAAPTPAAVRV